MAELSLDQKAYAVKCLEQIASNRDLKQPQLEQLSGVKQSTISKIFRGEVSPSEDVLCKLYEAMGLNLWDIIHEIDGHPDTLTGYLATPLTGIVNSPKAEKEIRSVVSRIKSVACGDDLKKPEFFLYWPGDHTHPIRNADFTPEQVYKIDRSRASTYNFIILFCAAPSFGVGQENEIATQAGLPAIRLLPEGVFSRMMSGSFIRAADIKYSGSLESGIQFSDQELRRALGEVRQAHYQLRALYKNVNGEGFGERLKKLADERWGNYDKLAEELGVSPRYLHALLGEPLSVSNPSAVLLRRMAHLFGVKASFMLGDSHDIDPVWVESTANWRKWINEERDIVAAVAIEVRDRWEAQYEEETAGQSVSSFRKKRPLKVMLPKDWQRLYDESQRGLGSENGGTLFKRI